MKKHSVCIDILTLLYSKLANDVDIIPKNVIYQYNEALKSKLDEEGKEYCIRRTTYEDQPQYVFNSLKDSNNNYYSCLNARYLNKENLEEIWNSHLVCQSEDLIRTSLDSELLAILGIFETKEILSFLEKVKTNSNDNPVRKKVCD